jgi:hypothetical protein
MEHILTPETIIENYTPPPPPPISIYKPHIRIDDTNLYYTFHNTRGIHYMTTSISNYPSEVDAIISDIAILLKPLYSLSKLRFSNVCGINSENVCSALSKPGGFKFGILFIYNFIFPTNEVNIAKIESLYGGTNTTIGVSYHALSYTEIIIDGNKLYIAIDTTICPYIQFYVANTSQELTTIICDRYQCNNFYITYDCVDWQYNFTDNIVLGRGKGKKYQKNKSHKTKWMRRKTHKIFKNKNKNKNSKKKRSFYKS